jgi:hypothetical protein
MPTVEDVSTTATFAAGATTVGCTFTVDFPTVNEDELSLLLIMARDTSKVIDTSATYTLLNPTDNYSRANMTGEIQGKIAGSSESAPSVHTNIENTQPTGAIVLAISGWSGDLADIVVAQDNGASSSPLAPAATITEDGSLVLRVLYVSDENVPTEPTDHATEFGQGTQQGSNAYLAVYSRTMDIGSTGTALATLTGGSDSWVFMTVVIPPSVGGGPVDLTVDSTVQGQTTESVAVTQEHALTGLADTSQGQTADAATLTQQHNLTVDSTEHGQTSEAPTLNAGSSLVVQGTAQGQLADSPALSQVHLLIVQDAVQGQGVEQPLLTQVHNLAVADTSHAQRSDNVALTSGGITTPSSRTFTIPAESRVVIVPEESRLFAVSPEVRVYTVEVNARAFSIG